MKVIVSVCEREAVEAEWGSSPGSASITEVVMLDSPISMKQLRCGLKGSHFDQWNLGLPYKDPFDGSLQWIQVTTKNFNDKFITFHGDTNDDGSLMINLAAWPDHPCCNHGTIENTGTACVESSSSPVVKINGSADMNATLSTANARTSESFEDSEKQVAVAVEAVEVDEGAFQTDLESGFEKKHYNAVYYHGHANPHPHTDPEPHHESSAHHHHHHHGPYHHQVSDLDGHPHHPHHFHHHGPLHGRHSHFRHHHGRHPPHGPPMFRQFGPRGLPIANPIRGPPFAHSEADPFSGPFARPGLRTGGGDLKHGRHKKGRKIQNLARFVEHITIPDDSSVSPGENCVKIWSVRNDSLMPWPEKCELIQVGGPELITGGKSVPVAGGLRPGEIRHISLDLAFPGQIGLYHAFFRLRAIDPATNEPGFKFGQRLWVKVIVATTGKEARLSKHSSSSSLSSSSSSFLDSSSNSDTSNNVSDRRVERLHRAKRKVDRKRKKRDKHIIKLQKQCAKLRKKLEKKSKKLERLISTKAKTEEPKPLSN